MFFWLEPNLTKWFGVAKRTKKDHFVLCFSLMKSTKNQGFGKKSVKMERGSRKNPHCLRRSRVVRILGFRANILAELSEALNFWFFWLRRTTSLGLVQAKRTI